MSSFLPMMGQMTEKVRLVYNLSMRGEAEVGKRTRSQFPSFIPHVFEWTLLPINKNSNFQMNETMSSPYSISGDRVFSLNTLL